MQPPVVAEDAETHDVQNSVETSADNKKSSEPPTTRVCMKQTSVVYKNSMSKMISIAFNSVRGSSLCKPGGFCLLCSGA